MFVCVLKLNTGFTSNIFAECNVLHEVASSKHLVLTFLLNTVMPSFTAKWSWLQKSHGQSWVCEEDTDPKGIERSETRKYFYDQCQQEDSKPSRKWVFHVWSRQEKGWTRDICDQNQQKEEWNYVNWNNTTGDFCVKILQEEWRCVNPNTRWFFHVWSQQEPNQGCVR